MQNVVLRPDFPPKTKVGVGTVSSREKAELKCWMSSDSVQLQEVIGKIPPVCSMMATEPNLANISVRFKILVLEILATVSVLPDSELGGLLPYFLKMSLVSLYVELEGKRFFEVKHVQANCLDVRLSRERGLQLHPPLLLFPVLLLLSLPQILHHLSKS